MDRRAAAGDRQGRPVHYQGGAERRSAGIRLERRLNYFRECGRENRCSKNATALAPGTISATSIADDFTWVEAIASAARTRWRRNTARTSPVWEGLLVAAR